MDTIRRRAKLLALSAVIVGLTLALSTVAVSLTIVQRMSPSSQEGRADENVCGMHASASLTPYSTHL